MGIGEMELSPDQFWSLTVHEFWIKESAWRRKENRARAELIRQAIRTTNYKKKDARQMEQAAAALTQYPIKRWTLPKGMTEAGMRGVLSRQNTGNDGQDD